MTKGYRYEEHMADVKFLAFGSSVEEAFRNSALALFDTTAEIEKLKSDKEKPVKFPVKVSASDYDDLLWKMLQYCLSFSDAHGLFCYKISKPSIKNGKIMTLSATVYCKEKTKRRSKLEVKGISKYELEAKGTKSGFRTVVVVDV